jgi:hypothetical protein
MMDLTLSQIAAASRPDTMFLYFLYDEKTLQYAAPRRAAPSAADRPAIRKIAHVVGSCRHRPAILRCRPVFLTRRFARHDSYRLIIYRFLVVSIEFARKYSARLANELKIRNARRPGSRAFRP